jgi:hypothetical protein
MKRALVPVFVVLSLILASSGGAQESRHRRATFLLGLGASLDSGLSSSFSNQSFQLRISFETEKDTWVAFRYGELAFDDGLDGDGFSTADLSYLTVAAEYWFNEGYYQSGLFFGIGAYTTWRPAARRAQTTTPASARAWG